MTQHENSIFLFQKPVLIGLLVYKINYLSVLVHLFVRGYYGCKFIPHTQEKIQI